jgi:hypothetical protein
MTEMILVIPFIAVVLSFLLFLGGAIVRLKSAHVIDRYEAWRQVAAGPGPAASGALVAPKRSEWYTREMSQNEPGNNQQLNALFFESKASEFDYSSERTAPESALVGQVALAYQASQVQGRMAASQLDFIRQMDASGNTMMLGRRVKIITSFPTAGTIWNEMEAPYRHSYFRIGNTWSAANAWRVYEQPNAGSIEIGSYDRGGPMVIIEPTVRDTFYGEFDGNMQNIVGPGKRLADSIRTFYNRSYRYCGPDLRFRCYYWWN